MTSRARFWSRRVIWNKIIYHIMKNDVTLVVFMLVTAKYCAFINVKKSSFLFLYLGGTVIKVLHK